MADIPTFNIPTEISGEYVCYTEDIANISDSQSETFSSVFWGKLIIVVFVALKVNEHIQQQGSSPREKLYTTIDVNLYSCREDRFNAPL